MIRKRVRVSYKMYSGKIALAKTDDKNCPPSSGTRSLRPTESLPTTPASAEIGQLWERSAFYCVSLVTKLTSQFFFRFARKHSGIVAPNLIRETPFCFRFPGTGSFLDFKTARLRPSGPEAQLPPSFLLFAAEVVVFTNWGSRRIPSLFWKPESAI